MTEGPMERRLFSLAELNHLRMEAMNIFEQCLTNGDGTAMVNFIEQQLVHNPPRLQLLRDLADDLQQRLLSLKEYHFDVRDRVVRTLSESYHVDITPLTPPSTLDKYHHLDTDAVLDYTLARGNLTDSDVLLLRKMIEASLQMAEQLHNDIQLTNHLYLLAVDWVEGMNVEVIKQNWEQHPSKVDINHKDLHH